MKKTKMVVFFIIICVSICLVSCYYSREEKEYYSQKDNYIDAEGTIVKISYNDEKTALYLIFSGLTPQFDDNCFKIVGDNLVIAQKRGIDQKINEGDRVSFITAPKYFGDGYVMPIVALTVDDEVILEFEEGFDNLQDWLN